MSESVTPFSPPEPRETRNYHVIMDRLIDSCAILKLIEDRDGPMQDDLVTYTTYEDAARIVRTMLYDLHSEVDRMATEAGRAQS